MTTPYYVKLVRLAEPRFLNRLGIPAEAPTFLSPQIVGSYRCTLCKATYSPLMYAPYAIVSAQHFHEKRGGINFFVTNNLLALARLLLCYGWLAQVEPIGKTIIDDGLGPFPANCGWNPGTSARSWPGACASGWNPGSVTASMIPIRWLKGSCCSIRSLRAIPTCLSLAAGRRRSWTCRLLPSAFLSVTARSSSPSGISHEHDVGY